MVTESNYQYGREVAEEKQLDRLVHENSQRYNRNIDKLFQLSRTHGIDSRVHQSIYQALLAPTPQEFPSEWPATLPALSIDEYGEFYTDPYALIQKKYKDKFDSIIGSGNGAIVEMMIEFAPIVNEQVSHPENTSRWSHEGYQDILFQLFQSAYDPEQVKKLFEYFDIKSSLSNEYQPLRNLLSLLKTRSKSEDWLRAAAAEEMHAIILAEKSDTSAESPTLSLYKDMIIELSSRIINSPASTNDEYRSAMKNGNSLELHDFVIDEYEWLLQNSEKGPFLDFDTFKKVVERFGWHVYKDYFTDQRCRAILMEIMERQILPSENYEGFVITNQEDEFYTHDTLLDRWLYADPVKTITRHTKPEVREYLEDQLRQYRTLKALGDKPFPDISQQSTDTSNSIPEFPRDELNNTGVPTKRI